MVLDPSLDIVVGGADGVTRALAAWSKRRGAPVFEAARGQAPRLPGYDGVSTVSFAKDGYLPAGNALAITIVSYDEASGQILDADVVINGKYAYQVSQKATPKSPIYDVRRVATHEIGHALGLSDEPANKTAVMYPYVESAARSGPTAPTSDDLEGVSALYGVAPGSGDHGACAASAAGFARVPLSARIVVFGALGVMALAYGRRRRSPRTGGAAFGALALLAVALPEADPRDADDAVTEEHGDALTVVDEAPLALRARVAEVHTRAGDGVFRTEVVVVDPACGHPGCEPMRVAVWGGTVNGVRQDVGGARVPVVGEWVGVTSIAEPSPIVGLKAARLYRLPRAL